MQSGHRGRQKHPSGDSVTRELCLTPDREVVDRFCFPGSPRGGGQPPAQERPHRADGGGRQGRRGLREASPTGSIVSRNLSLQQKCTFLKHFDLSLGPLGLA